MKPTSLVFLAFTVLLSSARAQLKSIQDFGVLPANTPSENAKNLQQAIDWATRSGAALYVDPVEVPYPIDGGIVLRKNVSLVGANGPTPRGTRHPEAKRPVGSVFNITDTGRPFITVESATRIEGIQFWYSEQELNDPAKIIPYPPTIQTSKTMAAQGVKLSNLTFYGEYVSMDFNADPRFPSELILIEHCYGYPLSGEFIRIDYCYDIPRFLHCHVNPSIMREIGVGFSKAVIDAVVGRETFAYSINHTDNAQLMDLFTFATWGGIRLGDESYGQLTNFNLDCVAVGIHKYGSQSKNRNWQIAQGSIIANAGKTPKETRPIIIEGRGHTAISNVEAFSGDNGTLTNIGRSYDFLWVKGNDKLTISLFGCRMRNYTAADPLTIDNPKAVIQAVACVDHAENPYNRTK